MRAERVSRSRPDRRACPDLVSRSSAAPPAQATLLAAISGMPHHHPGLLTTPVRVVTIGVVGGFVAATVVAFQMSPSLAGAFVAPIVGGALIEATSYERRSSSASRSSGSFPSPSTG